MYIDRLAPKEGMSLIDHELDSALAHLAREELRGGRDRGTQEEGEVDLACLKEVAQGGRIVVLHGQVDAGIALLYGHADPPRIGVVDHGLRGYAQGARHQVLCLGIPAGSLRHDEWQ